MTDRIGHLFESYLLAGPEVAYDYGSWFHEFEIGFEAAMALVLSGVRSRLAELQERRCETCWYRAPEPGPLEWSCMMESDTCAPNGFNDWRAKDDIWRAQDDA